MTSPCGSKALCLAFLALSLSAVRAQSETLRGSLRLADGSPWVGATVVLEQQVPGWSKPLETESDDAGRYEFRVIPGVAHRMYAWSRIGHALRFAGPRDHVTSGRERPLQAWQHLVTEPTLSLEGIEAWTKRVPKLRLVDERGIEAERLAEDRIRFSPHPMRTRTLYVLDERGLPCSVREVLLVEGENGIRLAPPKDLRVTVSLGAKRKRPFRVLTPFGDSVVDAEREGLRLTYGVDGTEAPFTILGFTLMILPDGCPATAFDAPMLRAEATQHGEVGVHVALARGLPIGGRLRSSRAPVAKRRLFLWAKCNRVTSVTLEPVSWAHGAVPMQCDENGQFVSHAILSEGYSLFAVLDEREAGRMEDGTQVAPFALVHADIHRSQRLDIDLDELQTVTLRVVDHAGRHVPRATVVVANADALDAGGPTLRSDRRGRLALRVARSTLLAIVACSDDATTYVRHRVHGSGEVRVALRKPLEITGTLVDKNDKPVAGVALDVTSLDIGALLFGEAGLQHLIPRSPHSTTASDGSFRIRLAAPSSSVFLSMSPVLSFEHAAIEVSSGTLTLGGVQESRLDVVLRTNDFQR